MIKQNVLNVINEMPEFFTVDEIMHKLYIMNNHERAMQDIEEGNIYSTNEVRQIMAKKVAVSR
jgi:hypothetical protein